MIEYIYHDTNLFTITNHYFRDKFDIYTTKSGCASSRGNRKFQLLCVTRKRNIQDDSLVREIRTWGLDIVKDKPVTAQFVAQCVAVFGLRDPLCCRAFSNLTDQLESDQVFKNDSSAIQGCYIGHIGSGIHERGGVAPMADIPESIHYTSSMSLLVTWTLLNSFMRIEHPITYTLLRRLLIISLRLSSTSPLSFCFYLKTHVDTLLSSKSPQVKVLMKSDRLFEMASNASLWTTPKDQLDTSLAPGGIALFLRSFLDKRVESMTKKMALGEALRLWKTLGSSRYIFDNRPVNSISIEKLLDTDDENLKRNNNIGFTVLNKKLTDFLVTHIMHRLYTYSTSYFPKNKIEIEDKGIILRSRLTWGYDIDSIRSIREMDDLLHIYKMHTVYPGGMETERGIMTVICKILYYNKKRLLREIGNVEIFVLGALEKECWDGQSQCVDNESLGSCHSLGTPKNDTSGVASGSAEMFLGMVTRSLLCYKWEPF